MPEKMLGLEQEQNQECRVEAHYFASQEGKSDSDTAGSLEKLRAERIMLRNTDMVVTNTAQLVSAILGSAPPPDDSATAKYSFRIVEEMPAISRVVSHQRPAIQIKGIRNFHYFGVFDGCLKAKTVSCLSCLGSQEECEDCRASVPLKTALQLKAALSLQVQEDDEEFNEMEAEESGEVTAVQSDEEESDSESEDEDSENEEDSEEFVEGCYVWAPFGRKMFPAKVVSLGVIPQVLHRQLNTRRPGQMYVRWIGEVDSSGQAVDRFSSVRQDKLKVLGDDVLDHSLGRRCPMQFYQALNQALTPS